MKDPKTTTLGILTIAGALIGAAIGYLQNGTLPSLGNLIAALTAGWGLITARDSKPTPPVTQQGITAKLPLILILCGLGFVLFACANAPSGSSVLTTTFADVEPALEPGAALATTGFLASQGASAGVDAGYAEAAAVILQSLTGGSTAPAVSQVQAALTAVAPKNAQYLQMVPVIVSLYSGVVPKASGTAELNTALQDIAAGVSEAAAAYVPAKANKTAGFRIGPPFPRFRVAPDPRDLPPWYNEPEPEEGLDGLAVRVTILWV